MSLIDKHIIPGKHGKIFATNAKAQKDLENIKKELMTLEGIENVELNFDIFPKEFTVHSSQLVNIDTIENVVISIGFHAIPKTML